MFHKYRERILSSTDSESDHSVFNRAFQSSSAAGITSSFNSTNFTSTEAIHPTDTDESEMRKIIENDTFLRNVSKNDSLQICRNRSPSLIIASGTVQGSTANTSIESLQSTIIDGAIDSDASFYSPNETLTNLSFSTEHVLNKRLSEEEDDEFLDCVSSPEFKSQQPLSTSSTKYKSLGLVFSPKSHSENNNTIFKQNRSTNSQVSGKYNVGSASNIASNSSRKFPELPISLQHLTTILEESTGLSNTKRISGVQLMPIVENLRKAHLANIPESEKFEKNMSIFAQILNKSSREITLDQLTQILLYTLHTNFNYSEHLSDSGSLCFSDISRVSGIDSDNTGEKLDSIIRQLRIMCSETKNIESESSPEWPLSQKSSASRTTRNVSLADKENQKYNSFKRKKEYFPMPPFTKTKCSKEKCSLSRTGCRKANIVSPKKNKVSFATELCSSSDFNYNFGKIQKKKYAATPHFKRNENVSEVKKINVTTASDESFLLWENTYYHEERQILKNLRRSLSVPDVTEESTTSQTLHSDYRRDSQKLQIRPKHADNEIQDKLKTCRRRRSKSVENKSYFALQTNFGYKNDSLRNKINLPSTSEIQKKKSLNREKEKSRSYIPTARFINSPRSAQRLPVTYKNKQKTSSKNSCQKTSNKNVHSRRSGGIDSSHIPAVSQLRRVFSPLENAQGSAMQQLNVPRIEITKSSPEQKMNNSPTPILTLRRKKMLSKSQDKNSPRKPWKP